MGKGKKKVENNKVLVAEFRVSMHCNACERSVAKAISKIKGVETFMTDMPRQRVVVKGRMNWEKVAKKIRKKAGKRTEMLRIEEVDQENGGNKCSEKGGGVSALQQETSVQYLQLQHHQQPPPPLEIDPCWDSEVYTMFSDENPNACSIV